MDGIFVFICLIFLICFTSAVNVTNEPDLLKIIQALNMKLKTMEERQAKQEIEIGFLRNEKLEMREKMELLLNADQDHMKTTTDLEDIRNETDSGDLRDLAGRRKRTLSGKVAFSAYVTRSYIYNLGPRQIIPYEATYINEGNGFDTRTSIFTVPVNGVYLFAFSAQSYYNHRMWLNIYVDAVVTSTVLESTVKDEHSMGTGVVIFRLKVGQKVWVATNPAEHDDQLQGAGTTFSGVLLYS